MTSPINITSDGQTVAGQEPYDVINDPTNSDDTIFSYQGADSHTQITIGAGINNTVWAHTFDTVTVSAPNGTIGEYQGHDNVFNLGDGNYNVSLGVNDRLSTGNGNSTINFYAGATNDTLTLGNGNNSVNNGGQSGNFTVAVGTGSDTLQFFAMQGGSLAVTQASGGGTMVVDVSGTSKAPTSLASFTATVTNRSDVLITDNSNIAHFVLNVAVDGYKVPYAATVNYVATGETIAAPYNIAAPLPYFIADLLFDPAPRWTDTIGVHATAPTITFSFMQSLPRYATATDANGFATLGPDLPTGMTPQQLLTANTNHTITLNAAELSAVTVLAAWETVANINFVSAADSNAVQIRIGSNSQGSAGSAGYSYDPLVPAAPYYGASGTQSDAYSESGDVYINKDMVTPGYFSPGGGGGHIFAHEIGHALGMGGESGATDPHDVLPSGQDLGSNTVMSYQAPYQEAPQVFDIATIQYLYGPNPNYHPNPSHVWSFSAAGGATNLVSDGGGSVNTISAQGTTAAAYIDLRPGHWSWLGAQSADILDPDQMMIDYGTVVTNVIAGNGAETIVCNDNGDTVTCGTGADTVICAGGADTINIGTGGDTIVGAAGTNGLDTAVFSGTSSAYSIAVNGDGSVTASSHQAGTLPAHLSAVEYLQFADRMMFVTTPAQAAIALLYQGTLGRVPDPSGLTGWENAFATEPLAAQSADPFTALAGTPVAGLPDIAYGFTTSSEFQAKYGSLSDTQFVTQLYENMLDRAPDLAGLNGWLAALGQGHTREWVVAGFVESPENITNAEAGYVGQSGPHAAWLVVT
jgi:hypothetical protein